MFQTICMQCDLCAFGHLAFLQRLTFVDVWPMSNGVSGSGLVCFAWSVAAGILRLVVQQLHIFDFVAMNINVRIVCCLCF